MTPLAEIDLFADAQHAAEAVHFRARDTYSLSDKRRCLRLAGGDQAQFAFDLSGADIPAGTAELCLTASLEVLDSHAYVYKFLNSLLTVRLNGETVFDGMVHWRSHEETASYWPTFDFAFDSALLQPGANTVAVTNRSSREALGDAVTLGRSEQRRPPLVVVGVMEAEQKHLLPADRVALMPEAERGVRHFVGKR